MTCFQTCFNFLKTFDQYGIRPSLYYKGKSTKGTGFGFFLTLILSLVTMACFIYFGQNVYYRKNPSMSYHEEYISFPEPFILNAEDNPIFIELNSFDGSTYFTDNAMLTAKVSQYTISKNNNKTHVELTNYSMEICTEDHIKKLNVIYQEYFQKKNLSNFFCIPKEIKNLTMQGGFDQEVFQSIKFSFSLCKNSQNCLDKETIKNYMRRGYIGIYFLDLAIDAADFLNPKKVIPKEVFTNYVLDFQKEIDIYFKNNYLISEEGLVLAEAIEEKMVNYDDFQELNFMIEDDEFLQIYFKIKQMKSIYMRSYDKIQDLLGLVGGFLNFFYLLGFLLNNLYVRLFLITDLLLDIFTIKISQKKEPLAILTNINESPGTTSEAQRLHSETSESNAENRTTKSLEKKKPNEFLHTNTDKIPPKILYQEESISEKQFF